MVRQATPAQSSRGGRTRSHRGVIVDGGGSRAVYASYARPGILAAWPLYGGQSLGVAPFMNFCVTIGESKATSVIMIRSRCVIPRGVRRPRSGRGQIGRA